MKVTIDEITYEGTEGEIRRIVENPPHRQTEALGVGTRDAPRCPRYGDSPVEGDYLDGATRGGVAWTTSPSTLYACQ